MKIFSWMRSRFSGKESNIKPAPESISHHVLHQDCKEEFSDWPNALLAIGTFGNNNLKDQEKSKQDHLENTTPEEFGEVDKELRQLLKKHISVESGEPDKLNYLLIDKLLDCLSDDTKSSNKLTNKAVENNDTRLQRINSVVCRGEKDIRLDSKSSGIGKKSLRFLLKKVLLCRGGFEFAPNPMLRDPHPEPKLDSRMEKLLRSMLAKRYTLKDLLQRVILPRNIWICPKLRVMMRSLKKPHIIQANGSKQTLNILFWKYEFVSSPPAIISGYSKFLHRITSCRGI